MVLKMKTVFLQFSPFFFGFEIRPFVEVFPNQYLNVLGFFRDFKCNENKYIVS